MRALEKILKLTEHKTLRAGLFAASTVLMLAALYLSLVWAPSAVGETEAYRIIYFHVPTAIMAYLGFFIVFAASAAYLWKNDPLFDRLATVGAELGVLFCLLMLLTGMIWGKQRWGAWWLWEPRLTTALILLVIYVGYLMLRNAIDNQSTRAKYAAVFGIVGFIDVPIVHFAIKMWGNVMHPVVIKSAADTGMSPEMTMALRVSMLAFLSLFVSAFLLRFRLENLSVRAARVRSGDKD